MIAFTFKKCYRITVLALLLLSLPLTVVDVTAKDAIIWVNDNLPPAFIVDGPDNGKGIVDGVVSLYKNNLREYDHHHVVANMARILFMMKDGQKICYAGFLKTPQREAYIKFSLPNLINYGNAVIVKASRAEEIAGSKEFVSLIDLLDRKDLKAGLTRDRSYGRVIDRLLQADPQSANLFYRSGQNSLQGLIQMLVDERIDYTIGYPWEVPYIAHLIGLRDQLSVFLIEETRDQYWIKNYVGCPDTEWGRRTIEKIDAVLRVVRPTEAYIHHQLKWFPRNMEQEIRAAYDRYVLSAIR